MGLYRLMVLGNNRHRVLVLSSNAMAGVRARPLVDLDDDNGPFYCGVMKLPFIRPKTLVSLAILIVGLSLISGILSSYQSIALRNLVSYPLLRLTHH
jgi:hypothetical protein